MNTVFLHSSSSQHQAAMLEVRSEFGWKGYGQYWAIIEAIAGSKSGRISWLELRALFNDDIENYYVWCLADHSLLECHIDEVEVKYSSPILEAQAADPKLARHLRLLAPRTTAGRPGIPRDVRLSVLSIGCCAYCGSVNELQIDHIHPYSRGGAHSIENFQPLCRPCNSAKRDKTEAEYFALIGR